MSNVRVPPVRDERRLPFPWSNGEGLTATLRDPSLWQDVFDLPHDQKAVQKAARKASIYQGESEIGALAIKLLETKLGREFLEREFKRLIRTDFLSRFVPRRMRSVLNQRGIVLPPSLYVGTGARATLDIGSLENSPDSLQNWNPSQLLLAITPFAMYGPNRQRLVSAIQKIPAVSILLDTETVVSNRAVSAKGSALETEAANHKVTVNNSVNVVDSIVEVSVLSDVNHPAEQNTDILPTVFTVQANSLEWKELQELRQLVPELLQGSPTLSTLWGSRDVLRRSLASVEARVSSLERQRDRTHKQLRDLRTRPWLANRLPPDEVADFDRHELVEDVEIRLSQLDTAVSELFSLCGRLEELSYRTDKDIPVPLATESGIGSLVNWFKEQVGEFELQLSYFAENDARVVALISDLLETTPEFAARAFDSFIGDLVILGLVLVGDYSYVGTQSASAQRLRKLQHSKRPLGLLLTALWHASQESSAPLLRAIGRLVDRGDDIGSLIEFMPPGSWESAIATAPQLAFPIVAQALASAVNAEDGTGLDYALPALEVEGLHRGLREFMTALRSAHHSEQLAGLRAALGDTAASRRRYWEAERTRQRISELIRRQPGMTGHYHHLRVDARVHFLLPLQELVDSNDAKAVSERWELTSVEEMTQQTRRLFDRRDELDSTHLTQLSSYLSEFDSLIRLWLRLSTPTTTPTLRTVSSTWKSLLEERGAATATFVHVVQKILEWDGQSSADIASYIRPSHCSENGANITLQAPNSIVDSRMTWSYPRAVEFGRVEVPILFIELFRIELDESRLTIIEAIEQYLQAGKWEVSRSAASGVIELEEHVALRMEAQRRELRTLHSEILLAAEDARLNDEYVDLALTYALEAIAELNSDHIAEAFQELESQIRRFRLERDPQRVALVDYLREAGKAVDADETVEQLESRIEQLKRTVLDRRVHIDELTRESTIVPIGVRDPWNSLSEAWRAASRRMDRPCMWPSSSHSQRVAEAIDDFRRYLLGQSEGLVDDPATVTLLLSRFEQWLPAHLSIALQPNGERAMDDIFSVSQEIRRYAPATKILRMLGHTGVPRRSRSPIIPESGLTGVDPARGLMSHGQATTPLQVDVIAQIRIALRGRFPRPISIADEINNDELRRLCRSEDWPILFAATAFAVHDDLGRADRLSIPEVVFAVAAARTSLDAAVPLYMLAAIGVIANPDADYVLGVDLRNRFVVDAIAVVAGTDHSAINTSAVTLTVALERLCGLPVTDPAVGYVAQILTRLALLPERNNIAPNAIFASILWDVFKGHASSASRRSLILLLLFKLRQLDALRHLAAESRPLDTELMQCVIAFDRSESAPEIRPRTLQISAAIRERSKGKNKPWTILFARLESSFAADETSGTLEVLLVSSTIDPAIERRAILQVQLTPPLHDAPVNLSVEIAGSHVALLQDDEPLLKERTVSFTIEGNVVALPGEESRIPYRITGTSIRGNMIDLRGAWRLSPQQVGRLPRITNVDIQRAWPGAKGDPVTQPDPDLFGREAERKQLRSQLIDGHRPQSVMIFGQRRVGKTSLLWQMIRELPPRPGAVAAAFVDVSAVDQGSGSFARALVTHIAGALDFDQQNEAIRIALRRGSGERIEISKLLRGLQLDNLFYALEGLVDRLRDCSRGAIHHLALFVDEFDRYIEPLQNGRSEETKSLLWQIRQIVQQSNKVALVLAGSGLQRVMSEDYNTPLFGSIAQLDIGPFRSESAVDRSVIARTFLPAEVRNSLCRDDDLPLLLDAAYELTGGYPYYLAMLGYSAALLSDGMRLTPAILERSAEEMIRGNVPNLTWRVNGGNFYLHIFETASRLPLSKQIAVKLVLAYIGAQTSREYPWLSREVIDLAELPKLIDQERHEALTFLERERVIDVDRRGSRVRIVVPLTAAAIREAAPILREEAVGELRRWERDKDEHR